LLQALRDSGVSSDNPKKEVVAEKTPKMKTIVITETKSTGTVVMHNASLRIEDQVNNKFKNAVVK